MSEVRADTARSDNPAMRRYGSDSFFLMNIQIKRPAGHRPFQTRVLGLPAQLLRLALLFNILVLPLLPHPCNQSVIFFLAHTWATRLVV